MKKPHIIMIVADDLGWNDVSFHGSKQIPTPNIDKLASEGIILNNYYTLPTCTPSRSALMTGRYPIHTGMQSGVIEAASTWGLPLNETLLPQHLKKQGYKTHAIGKWHLGFYAKEYLPTYRGFDSFYGYYLGKSDYWTHSANESYSGLDLHDNEEPVWNQNGTYGTEIFTAKAEERIANHDSSEPLFLYVANQAVHEAMEDDPLQAPQEWIDKYKHIQHEKRRIYAAMVGYMDYGVGRIYNALRKKGILDNSILLFTTDNGGAPNGFTNNWANNFPLRGVKASLFEGGVRGAAFVYSKLFKHTGRVSNDLMHITDWLPTFVNLAGGHIPKNNIFDGFDQSNSLQKMEPSPRKEVLLNIDHQAFKNTALRVGDWKIMRAGFVGLIWGGWYPPPAGISNATTDDSIRYVEVNCGGPIPKHAGRCVLGACLFNIAKDPCEFHDVSTTYPHIFKSMMSKLGKYEASMVPPLQNQTADPMANPALHNGVWEPWVTLHH